MIKSFRLRLALVSALMSGLILAAFGIGSLWSIRNTESDKIKSEIQNLLHRQLPLWQNSERWAGAEAKLKKELGVRNERSAAIRVARSDGVVLYQSLWWPTDLKLLAQAGALSYNSPALDATTPGIFGVAHAADVPFNQPMQVQQGGAGQEGAGRFQRQGADSIGMDPRREGRLPPGSFRPDKNLGNGDPGGLPRSGPGNVRNLPPPTTESMPPTDGAGRSLSSNMPGAPFSPTTNEALPGAEPTAPDTKPARSASGSSLPPALKFTTDVYLVAGDRNKWFLGVASERDTQLLVAVDADLIDFRVSNTRNTFLLWFPVALVLIGAVSWTLAGRAIQPLNDLTSIAQRVTAEGLGRRISKRESDKEFAELIDVFNKMLMRLDQSFKQSQRFSADAAHEIRTPLAIVQGQLERAISLSGDGSNMQVSLTSSLDEIRRLSAITSKLLLLAKADAGKLDVLTEVFDLSGALEDLIEDTRMLAPSMHVLGDIKPGAIVLGDESLLRQLLHNLVSNAIKYSVPDRSGRKWIRIVAAKSADHIEVTVANSSPGIPASQRELIFERFFRADSSHNRTVEGLGLGLSVSREIARAHGGELTLQPAFKDGVQFALTLPTRNLSIATAPTTPMKITM